MRILPADGVLCNASAPAPFPAAELQLAGTPRPGLSPARLAMQATAHRLTKLTRDAAFLATPLPLFDIAGSHVGGTILGRILYWSQAAKNGDTRLRVEREGKMWWAIQYKWFWNECRASEAEVKRALRKMARLGIIEWDIWKFQGEPSLHIRLIEEAFEKAWHNAVANPNTDRTYCPRQKSASSAPAPSGPARKKPETKPAKKPGPYRQKARSVSALSAETSTGGVSEVPQDKQQHAPRENFVAPPDVASAPPVAAVGVSQSETAPHGTHAPAPREPSPDSPVLAQVLGLGVEPERAARLLAAHGEERVARQIAWLPDRGARNAAAMLIRAVERDFDAPAAARPRARRQQEREQEALAAAQERGRREAQAERDRAQRKRAQTRDDEEEIAALNAAWDAMPEAERADMDAAISERWGELAERPATRAGLRRQVQRERGAPPSPPAEPLHAR